MLALYTCSGFISCFRHNFLAATRSSIHGLNHNTGQDVLAYSYVKKAFKMLCFQIK